MGISNDLIKKFVQITKDQSPVKHESTVYGTAVEYNGAMYVQLDGSELLTPVDTSTEIADGERVTVLIKDHTATVTGNLTNPSAGSNTVVEIQGDLNHIGNQITEFEVVIADKVSTKDFEANNAAINNLLAGKADVNKLTAVEADIRNLQAEDASIKNLVAGKADIDELNATKADVEKLEADKADIGDLNAAVGNINDLTADIAKIALLIGGSASVDIIQSIILTSQNTSIENALIKNAMIDNITADKISSGTINTNKVNIQSEDGGIEINGSTQQFKDQNGTVRVQIGKDAQGNFTFCLFSQDGSGILLDHEGIKAGAVPDGLIVNDMVADNANISGGKLDISSVVTEINNNSTTIKSSVIQFDDSGQSLLVAFNSLKDTVDSISDITINGDLTGVLSQVQTLSTELNVAQGQIDALITNTTITKENGQTIQLKDDYAETKLSVDRISTKVASLETNYESTLKMSSTQYYLSTSLIELAGGSWSDTAPAWTNGKYIWQRMKYTYTDNTVTYGTAICIAGAKGDTGARGPQGNDGVGISSIIEYYQVSASNTEPPTSWVTSPPAMSPTDKYLWSYEEITYSSSATSRDIYESNAVLYTGQYINNSGAIFDVSTETQDLSGVYPKVNSYLYANGNKYDDERALGMFNIPLSDYKEFYITATSFYSVAIMVIYDSNGTVLGAKGDKIDGDTTWTDKHIMVSELLEEYPTAHHISLSSFNNTAANTVLSVYATLSSKNASGWMRAELEVNPTTTYCIYFASGNYDTSRGQLRCENVNKEYISHITYADMTYDDIEGEYEYRVFTTPADCKYITFGVKSNMGTIYDDSSSTKVIEDSEMFIEDFEESHYEYTPKRVIGVYGDSGEKGQSLVSSTPQWYSSTSNTTQSGGSWAESMPAVTEGKYIWLRYKLVWANPTTTTYTTPTLEQIAESVKEVTSKQATLEQSLDGFKTTVSTTYTTKTEFDSLEIGGRNLLLGSGEGHAHWGWMLEGATMDTHFTLETQENGREKVFVATRDSSEVTAAWNVVYYEAEYVINSELTPSTDYVLSFDVMVSEPSVITWKICDTSGGNLVTNPSEIINVPANTWFKYEAVATSLDDFPIYELPQNYIYLTGFSSTPNSSFCIKNPKLERGNRATGWTPAPEDVDGNIESSISASESALNNTITATTNNVRDELHKEMGNNYVTKTDYEEHTISMNSTIEQTNANVNMTFERTSEMVQSIEGQVTTLRTNVETNIRFDENGIQIGKTDSPFSVNIDNTRMSFIEGTKEIAYISNNEMKITDANIQNSLTLGAFKFIPRTTGNVSLIWDDNGNMIPYTQAYPNTILSGDVLHRADLSTPAIPGNIYTIEICGDLGDRQEFDIWNLSNESNAKVEILQLYNTEFRNGVVRKSFLWTDSRQESGELIDLADWFECFPGYVESNGRYYDAANCSTYLSIPIRDYKDFYITAESRYSVKIMMIFDESENVLGYKGAYKDNNTIVKWENHHISVDSILAEYPTAYYISLSSYTTQLSVQATEKPMSIGGNTQLAVSTYPYDGSNVHLSYIKLYPGDEYWKDYGNLLSYNNVFTEAEPYSITAQYYDDTYKHTGIYAYLEAGKTYRFTCKHDKPWWDEIESGNDACQAYMYALATYDNHIHLESDDFQFTVPFSGRWGFRADANITGQTYKYWDMKIIEVIPGASETNTVTTEEGDE